jgi:hypothetical protein
VSDIPRANIPYVKGAFHIEDTVGYWLFSSDTAGYDYNRLLVINGLSGAFYPWSFDTPTDVTVRGIQYVKSPSSETPNIKLTVTNDSDLFYAEHRQETYLDWDDFGSEQDYDSYFVTGYKLEGQAMRFFQPNYIIVYSEIEDDASCFMQGLFDFTTSGNSGKWSTPQQIYSALSDRSESYTRRKVRGKGRALQLKFYSETGKPFTIIGWALWVTGNATV